MNLPPDPPNDDFPYLPEQNYPIPWIPSGQGIRKPEQSQAQPFTLQPAPPPPSSGIVVASRRRPRAQKIFLICALLLVFIVVLAVPFFALKNILLPNKSTTVSQPLSTATTINDNGRSSSNTTELGTVILPPAGKIMNGVSMPGDINAISAFEKSTGKNVSVLVSYQAWGATGNEKDFPLDRVNAAHQHGAIPLLTWEPWVAAEYPQGNNEPNYSLKNIIAGNFDSYIKKWAGDAKAWKNPFFLRFAPEMNGDWIPWAEGVNGNKTGEFVRAWQHVHDIFKAMGVTNATWMWCPNINYRGSIALPGLYPGDAYVDWAAMDGFNWGASTKNSSWLTFSQVFGATYTNILSITNKPIMIAETGSTEKGGNKAAWITSAYAALMTQFSGIKGIVWFNQVTQEDWRVNSSPAALRAFSQAMRSPVYAGNSYAHYLGG